MVVAVEQRGNHDLISLWESLRASGAISETELRLPPDITYEEYEALAAMFGRLKRTTSWLIGDLILYGDAVYGEKYTQAIELTGLAPSTLANYASVCKHIPPSRRRPGVSFSLHYEVAYLEPQDQERWLDMAVEGEWTKERLRQEIRGSKSDPLGNLADNGQDLDSRLILDSEEHPSTGQPAADGVPAVTRDLLGEPVAGPINLDNIALQISSALAWVPDRQRAVVIDNLEWEVRGKVRDLIDQDHY